MAWRQSLAIAFDLPSGNVNFDCPHGKPWSAEKPAPMKADAPSPRKPCAGCPGSELDPAMAPTDIEAALLEGLQY